MNPDTQPEIKLQIAFPKSSEDQKLQLVDINGSIFAIVYAPLQSLGPVHLNCEDWSIILLSPIHSKSNILISAVNVICLSDIFSEEGHVSIHASNKLVKFTQRSHEKVSEMGEKGEFYFQDDPAALLQFYRLFEGAVKGVKEGSAEKLTEAQQRFIMGICLLASKIGQDPEITVSKVLEIWNIQDFCDVVL
jgi:hypothetical protein